MPNSSKKTKEPGLEDELRKMILGNVRVQEDSPRTSPSPGNRYGAQSPRANSSRSPKPPGSNDGHRHQSNRKHATNMSSHVSGPNGARIPGQEATVGGAPPVLGSPGAGRQRQARQSQAPDTRLRNSNNSMMSDGDAFARPPPRSRQLYQPNSRPNPRPPPPAIFIAQCEYLDHLAKSEVAQSQMSYEEYRAKELYRDTLEQGFRQTLQRIGLPGNEILALQGFGSFSSGFATANSDVDLAVVLRQIQGQSDEQFARLTKEMPRLLEMALLDAGFGARLLDRTRVPIIKTCQAPTPELLSALRDERRRWDMLPEEEKYAPNLRRETHDKNEPTTPAADAHSDFETALTSQTTAEHDGTPSKMVPPQDDTQAPSGVEPLLQEKPGGPPTRSADSAPTNSQDLQETAKSRQRPKQKAWIREKPRGPLDFPKEGVGIQADINFSNALALHNTELLRCYSLCDARVQPMVLFVKAWAKRRRVNSSYNGTLSSYGYVLMVLHFLINIAQPPVLPNLQLMHPTIAQGPGPAVLQWLPFREQGVVCDGYAVRFWREPEQIRQLASRGLLTQNQEPLGVLMRNFFHYFAHQGGSVIGGGFQWTSEVLSLCTRGGRLKKEEKGWTGAKTTTTENREVRHRYLFAIEDPFELDHNVARTVTHHGIVAIRDEFRRAWKILMDIGNGHASQQGDLFDQVLETQPPADKDEAEQVESTPTKDRIGVDSSNDAAPLQTFNG